MRLRLNTATDDGVVGGKDFVMRLPGKVCFCTSQKKVRHNHFKSERETSEKDQIHWHYLNTFTAQRATKHFAQFQVSEVN